MMLGDYAQAHKKLTEAIMLAIRLKRKASILYQLETFTQLAFVTEHYVIAAQLYGYIIKHSKEDNIAFAANTLQRMEHYSAQMNIALEARFELLVNLGSRLSESAAAALAESLSPSLAAIKEGK